MLKNIYLCLPNFAGFWWLVEASRVEVFVFRFLNIVWPGIIENFCHISASIFLESYEINETDFDFHGLGFSCKHFISDSLNYI